MELKYTHYRDRVGLEWKVNSIIHYDDIINLINEMKKADFVIGLTKKHKMDIFGLRDHKEKTIKYLELIQNNHEEIDILTENKTDRFVIYMLCLILSRKYKRIVENGTKIIGCNEYLPRKLSNYMTCGCGYAPRKFWNYHYKNSYDDDIAYSIMPYTFKKGVKILKST